MGFIQRVNALVLKRIRKRSGNIEVSKLEVAGQLLHATLGSGERLTLDLHRLQRASAFKSAVPSGVEIGLLMEFDGPAGPFQISESCDGWLQVCHALDGMSGTTPYPTWYFAFVADNAANSLSVFPAEAV